MRERKDIIAIEYKEHIMPLLIVKDGYKRNELESDEKVRYLILTKMLLNKNLQVILNTILGNTKEINECLSFYENKSDLLGLITADDFFEIAKKKTEIKK